MKKSLHWLDENLEEFILVLFLIAMTLIMGIQVFCRYVLAKDLNTHDQRHGDQEKNKDKFFEVLVQPVK